MLSTLAQVAFFSLAGILLATTFGYLLLLFTLSRLRRARPQWTGEFPDLAVIVPVLNEAAYIENKLESLANQSYPRERMRILVVDGGSQDGTRELLAEASQRLPDIRVLNLTESRGKADQMLQTLALVKEEIVACTDADVLLEPDCLEQLVRELLADPRAALVGAKSVPQGCLAEERVHWSIVNQLWLLEGHALGAAKVGGACVVGDRQTMENIRAEVRGDDVHLALQAIIQGRRVLMSRQAHATEIRTPEDAKALVAVRRKRGLAYLDELDRLKAGLARRFPAGWACLVTWWHFKVSPWLVLVAAALAIILWPLAGLWTLAGLGLVYIVSVLAHRRVGRRPGLTWVGLPAALIRWTALTLLAMLLMQRRSKTSSCIQGYAPHETRQTTTHSQISRP